MTTEDLKLELIGVIGEHLAPYKAEMLRAAEDIKLWIAHSTSPVDKEMMQRRYEALNYYAKKGL